MAYSFPLTRPDFFNGLKLRQAAFYLDQPRQLTGTRGGEQWASTAGQPRWRGSFALIPGYHYEQGAIDAMLDVAGIPGATFLVHDERRIGPDFDRSGDVVSNASLALHKISVDRRKITISGLPVGAKIVPGDYVGMVRSGVYHLHRVNGTHTDPPGNVATKDGGTTVCYVTVWPPIPDSILAGEALFMKAPPIKAALVNPPQYGGARPLITEGASLEFVQVMS